MKSQPRQNLTQQLTHDLGFAIVRGVYPVNEGLPSEADLCVKYDVSRSATREAVKMLSAKGLISSRPKQGIRVLPESSWNMFDTDVLRWILSSKPSLSLLKEFTQVRVALEPQAAALAAENASAEQLAEIDNALARMADADQGLCRDGGARLRRRPLGRARERRPLRPPRLGLRPRPRDLFFEVTRYQGRNSYTTTADYPTVYTLHCRTCALF